MKTYTEFQNFCNQNLQKYFEELLNDRSIVVKKLLFIRAIIVFVLFGVVSLIYSVVCNIDYLFNHIFLLILVLISFLALLVLIFKLWERQFTYKQNFVLLFKDKIIKNIVKFFDESLTYYPEKFIDIDSFKNSGLITQRIDNYYGDDYVEGILGDTEIKFSEIHAFIDKKDKDNNRTYIELFGGLFFIGDFNKNFKGRTYVYPDFSEKIFGEIAKYFQKFNTEQGKLVNLEDVDFEKEFKVYSTDQIEARYILSTSLMQRIVNYKKKTKSDILMSFVDSKIYIGILIREYLFEPKIFGKLLNEETLQKYFEHFELVISIVEELNLNLRIWNKE